ncbi:MAG TPA: hypothetical protein VFU47_07235 [Armatimonadota bacterium]|nr:hypothetical protein [Armatimonadota bacterium]
MDYEWLVERVEGVELLAPRLNALQMEGWEIFQVLTLWENTPQRGADRKLEARPTPQLAVVCRRAGGQDAGG